MKKIVILLVAVFYVSSVSSQICLCNGLSEGICIDRPVSNDKIIEIFGQPNRTWTEEGEAIDGIMKTYTYEHLRIAVVNDIMFNFSFNNNDYQVLVYDKYRLKLGDNSTSFIASIPTSDILIRKYEENVMQLFFKMDNSDLFGDSSLLVTVDKEGRVTRISWAVPD